MRPISLEFKNIMAVGNKPVVIGFVENTITVIKGNIGSGKSTIIDVLSLNIFQKSYSGKNISDMINRRNKKNMLTVFKFEVGGHVYESIRGYKPDIVKLTKDGKSIPLSSKDDLTDKLLEILHIDRKIFDQTVFVSTKFFTPLMEMKSTEKKEFIKRLFQLQKYDDMRDDLNEQAKALRSEIGVLSGKKEVQETNVETEKQNRKERLEKYETDISSEKQRIAGLETEIKEIDISSFDELKTKKEEAETEAKKASVEYQSKKEALESQQKLVKKIKETKEVIRKHEEELKELPEDSGENIEEIESKMEELKTSGVETHQQITKAVETEKERKELIEKIQGMVVGVENPVEEAKKLEEDITKNKEKRLKLLNENTQNEAKAGIAKSEIERLEKEADVFNSSKCGTCFRPIDEKLRDEQITRIQNSINSLKKDIKEIEVDSNNNLEEIKELSETTQRQLDRKAVLDKDIRIFNERLIYQKQYDEKFENYIKPDVEKMTADLNKIKEDLGKLKTKKDELTNIRALKEKIAVLNDNMPEISETLSEQSIDTLRAVSIAKESELKIVSEIFDEIQTKKTEKEKKEAVLKEVCDALEKTKAEYETFKSDNKSVRLAEESLQRTVDLIEKKEYDLDLREKMIVAVGDKGIKKYVVGRYIPTLNQIVEKYLDVFGSEFRVKFESKKGLDAKVYERGTEISYSTLSNGQSQHVNFAILFTFIEFMKLRDNLNFPMLFLDEIFDGSMSPQALHNILQGIKQFIPYVNIITHRDQIYELGDNVISVKKNGAFSEYEFHYDVMPEPEINNAEESELF